MKKKIYKTPSLDGENGWFETTTNRHIILSEPLKGNYQFDIVIIGAGFTGISTAIRLAEIDPSLSIALVDALRIGQGTSGRNAGFLSDIPHHFDFNKFSIDEVEQSTQLSQFALDRLRFYKDQLNIPTWDDAGKYLSAREENSVKELQNFVQSLEKANIEYEWVEGDALTQRFGTDYYRASVYTKGNVLANPATLIRGVSQALPESITLFENSPVVGIDFAEKTQKIHCVGGQIQTSKVVLTTNGYLNAFGIAGNKTLPIFTYASLTAPLSDTIYHEYFNGIKPWGTTPAHYAGTTVRLTHDRRIFIRNSFDYCSSLRASGPHRETAWKIHNQSFIARFPFLKEMNFQYTWGGLISLTRNQNPQFESPRKNVFVVAGCNGSGVVKGTYLGYYMADYILGIDSENLRFILKSSKPNWIPRGPIRSVVTKYRIPHDTNAAKGDV